MDVTFRRAEQVGRRIVKAILLAKKSINVTAPAKGSLYLDGPSGQRHKAKHRLLSESRLVDFSEIVYRARRPRRSGGGGPNPTRAPSGRPPFRLLCTASSMPAGARGSSKSTLTTGSCFASSRFEKTEKIAAVENVFPSPACPPSTGLFPSGLPVCEIAINGNRFVFQVMPPVALLSAIGRGRPCLVFGSGRCRPM